MLYIKIPGTDQPLPISFDHLWREFDFRELITYQKNREAIISWMEVHPNGVADIAAAVFAQVNYRKPMDALLTRALMYCERMLEERGYKPTVPSHLLQDHLVDTNDNHVVLVVGCQGPATLESRARAAYDLLRQLPHQHFLVVFSGVNPVAAGTGLKVQIPDEALALETTFLRLINNDSTFATQYTTKRENKSARTEMNVANFFSGPYLRKDQPAVLYVVSSSFHLPRLTAIVEAHLPQNSFIQSIVAIGSEDSLEGNPVVREPAYVKWMMFTIYEHLLKYSPRHLWG